MEGCPCCVSGADKEKIHSKPIKQLEEGDQLQVVSFIEIKCVNIRTP
jgi:hypothetical protein